MLTSPSATLFTVRRMRQRIVSLAFGDGLVRVTGRQGAAVILATALVNLALTAASDAHSIQALFHRLHAADRALVAPREILSRRIGLRLIATGQAQARSQRQSAPATTLVRQSDDDGQHDQKRIMLAQLGGSANERRCAH
jgi:hypothetical protein